MKPNIIFVLLDGARVDRTHISSEFSELLRQGTFLNNVSTAIPYTFGSLNVILTGEYGKENGVDGYYKVFQLKDNITFLPEILQKYGYFTSRGLISDGILSKRGFNVRKEYDEHSTDLELEHSKLIKETFENAKGNPFFLFLQYTRIHTVTVTEVLKKFDWDSKDYYKNKIRNLEIYDEIFKETGKYAKKITDIINELDISENTIIVFFSDHGTGVGERFGERNYGSFTFEETIRTFYLFIGPKIIRSRLDTSLLSTVDIFPTILDLSGIKFQHNNKNGKSFSDFLLGKIESPSKKEFTFSETGALHGPYVSPEKSNVFCIKSNDFKLVYMKTPDIWEFYDLRNDPGELVNVFGQGIELENIMKEKLLEWINR